MSDNCLVKCMIVIVDRGKSDAIVRFLRGKNIMCSFVMPGYGTASAQWQNLLGIGDTKKDVIITLLDKSLTTSTLQQLNDNFGIHNSGYGVAFTVGVTSIGGRRLLNYCMGKVEE